MLCLPGYSNGKSLVLLFLIFLLFIKNVPVEKLMMQIFILVYVHYISDSERQRKLTQFSRSPPYENVHVGFFIHTSRKRKKKKKKKKTVNSYNLILM